MATPAPPAHLVLVEDRIPGVSPAASGAPFALPHPCRLLRAPRVHQAVESLAAFTGVRPLLGVGRTLGLGGLGGLSVLAVPAAERAHGRPPGGTSGTPESVAPGGAVAAGFAKAAATGLLGLPAPLPASTATALLAPAAATPPALFRRSPRIRWSR
ncbi:hypothetical protein [Streptomyces sp. NPDC055060]